MARTWQSILKQAITDPFELLDCLSLPHHLVDNSAQSIAQFRLLVPRTYVARMRIGDANDPLLLQVLPRSLENDVVSGYSHDPLQELKANPVPGLLHKFNDRALFIAAGACGVNCRYCFRRHFPYTDNIPGLDHWQPALQYLEQHTNISEVILSGGDPLIAKDDYIKNLIDKIETVDHVKRLRIHTRMPVVIPQRITSELITLLTKTRLQPIVVLHINHAQEIDESVTIAVKQLRAANIDVFNQSVLLKNINDNITALSELCESLFSAGIIPYYLHMLDKVQGAAHFAVEKTHAETLIQLLMQRLPGYMVPSLVKESPGAPSKIRLNSSGLVA